MRIRTVQNIFFFVLVLLTTVAFGALISDLLHPLFWAAVLAVVFRPLQQLWCRAVHGRESLAALLTVTSVVLIVIVPLVLIGLAVARESGALYQRIVAGEIDFQEPLRRIERAVPVVRDYLARAGIELQRVNQGLSGVAVTASRFVASQALAVGQHTLRIGALFLLMLYVLFFFLRDGRELIAALIRALPLGDVRERRLLAKFAEVSRATLKGTLIVGAIQGILGGLLFWVLGLTAPLFWGVIMTVLSVIPAVGAGLVWLPAAIILLVTGSVAKGIVLIIGGALVVGMVDNVLRPILVGRDTRMPDYVILLATLGGITMFGLAGFVMGPIIASLFMAVWQMMAEEYGEGDELLATPEPRARPEQGDPQPQEQQQPLVRPQASSSTNG